MSEVAFIDADGTVRLRGTLDPPPSGGLPEGWTVNDPEDGNLNGNRGASVGTAALNGIQSIDASPDPGNPDPTADLAITAPNGLNLNNMIDVNPDTGIVAYSAPMEMNGNVIDGLPDPGSSDEALPLGYAENNFVSTATFEGVGALLSLVLNGGGTAPHEFPAVPTPQNIVDGLLAAFPSIFTQA